MFCQTKKLYACLVLMLVLLGSTMLVTPVLAAGIPVNTAADEDNNNTDANCSLREAITAANNDAAYGGCSAGSGSDTITLPAGTYTLNDQLLVNSTIIINGSNATVQANASPNTATYRVLEVTGSANLTLNVLTIQHGNCDNNLACTSSEGNPDDNKGRGGGIFNAGILTLNDSFIANNFSASGGGGVYQMQGTLVVTGSTFTANAAGGDGGAISGLGVIGVTNSNIVNNAALSGGGIATSGGTLNVIGSLFSTNAATGSGGGIISSGNLSVKTSSFHDNTADRGGGIFNGGGTNSFVANSTFYSNTVTSNGGGIFNYEDLTVTNSTFQLNAAANNGGAFYSDPYQHENDSPVRYAVVTLKNTILANSTSGSDCFNYVNGVNVPIIGNNNLIRTDSAALNACGTTAPINNTDPKLGTLAGFPLPQYYPLLAGSPALDAGRDTDCAATLVNNTSQNKVTRPQGVHCDIGAYEAANKVGTTTILTAAPNPSLVGQTVVFTATVTAITGTPTGTVTFAEAGATLGTSALSGGVAKLTKSDLPAGAHTISATYSGNVTFNGSTASRTQIVNNGTKANTTTMLTSAPNPSAVGQLVVFTATVTATTGTPTGTVTFVEAGTTLGTSALSNGVAKLTKSDLPTGTYTITATYSGNVTFNSSTASHRQTVNSGTKAATTTELTVNPNPAGIGQTVVFKVTVTGAGDTPTGTVTICRFAFEGCPIIPFATISLSGGVGILTVNTLSEGNSFFLADYGGDANFRSSSGSLAHTVTAASVPRLWLPLVIRE